MFCPVDALGLFIFIFCKKLADKEGVAIHKKLKLSCIIRWGEYLRKFVFFSHISSCFTFIFVILSLFLRSSIDNMIIN